VEADDASLPTAAAIETDVVRAQAGGEAGGKKKLALEARDLEVEVPAALIPIEREIAIDLSKTGDSLFYRRRRRGTLRLLLREDDARANGGVQNRGDENEGRESDAHGVVSLFSE
jgi:hypothetical protein